MMSRRLALALLGASILAPSPGPAAAADAPTKLKLVLNWKYQGSQGMFFLADDRGYFKAEGLEVTLDQGNGSGAAVPLVANGTYDVGFGDINALIELAAKKPDDAPIAVYVMFNQPPFTVAVKADSPIKTPKDFEGKTLGGAANDGALKLFPALCKLAKFDCSKVNITNMQPNLREQMLMQGQVDGVFGYVTTIRFSAKLTGIDPDKQFRFIKFGDYGMDLYSNGVMVSRKLLTSNPKAVAGLVRAINKGLLAVAKDQNAGMKAALNYDNLINVEVEKRRLQYSFDKLIVSAEMKEIGVGDIKDDRMTRNIGIIVEGYQLARAPTPSEIFTREFLPPRAERELVYTAN